MKTTEIESMVDLWVDCPYCGNRLLGGWLSHDSDDKPLDTQGQTHKFICEECKKAFYAKMPDNIW